MTEDQLLEALKQVKYPGFSRDIVSFGLVKKIEIAKNGHAEIQLRLQTRDPKVPQQIFQDCHAALDPIFPKNKEPLIKIEVEEPLETEAPGQEAKKPGIPGVKHIIAIASGKGGVGKSTISSNLAVALHEEGLRVGICDCDLYGPSIAKMFGVEDAGLVANEKDEIIPIQAHGLKLMSMGFLLSDTSPVIVRGPLANRYTQQFLKQVAWGGLDVLILDLPPGTGDIQLTIVQTINLTGSVIVTTPQEVALIDARKAISMFSKVEVPILGIIENMSWFEGNNGQKYHLFGKEGGTREAEKQGVPLLAQIPLSEATCQAGDNGRPIACGGKKAPPISAPYYQAAKSLISRLSLK